MKFLVEIPDEEISKAFPAADKEPVVLVIEDIREMFEIGSPFGNFTVTYIPEGGSL